MTSIAIVGIACRLPGAADAASFWRLLTGGGDAISEVPRDRFDAGAYRYGGFLDDIDGFDAAFFGISPREAASMDPQQRLMLELAHHALEDAGIPPARIRGTAAGVFTGVMWSEFASLALSDPLAIAQHTASGADTSIIAGRVSYFLNLHGPSLTINTGCSSSLVAVHLACESLRRGETSTAIAGGVNLMLAPETTLAMAKLGVLSPAGRCRAFDAAADGYVRSEGGALVVLKPLAGAIRDRDRIYATIAGSAMNNDGATIGLTAPSAEGQARVLRDACAAAGVYPGDVDYVEAHGTGTAMGDRVEAEALGAAYGRRRPGVAPLAIGSVKTNIGHLEGASGVAGLIKTALCLQHRRLVANLHFAAPNPQIDFERFGLEVIGDARDWPARGRRKRRAGVSSFGFGGTNCHVIVEEWIARSREWSARSLDRAIARRSEDRRLHLFLLTARSPEALEAQAAQLREYVSASPDLELDDLAFSLASTREPFEHRLTIAARDRRELEDSLELAGRGFTPANATRGQVPVEQQKIAFLFTGQGSQYAGMGRDLYEHFPAFRDALDRCAAILAPVLRVPLLDVMFADAGSATAQLLDTTEYAQPAIFALEWGLAELWRRSGIVPDAVLGHSLGEYVAACVAGVMSLDDGLRLAAARGRLMQTSAPGAMAACEADAERVAAIIAPWRDALSIAAENAPDQVVISGTADAVGSAAVALAEQGIVVTPLPVAQAFHSPLIDPLLDAFEAEVRRVELRAPNLALVSNLGGALAAGEIAHPEYWRRHAREPVRFEAGLRTLASLGIRTFVELGPRPVLLGIAARMHVDGSRWLPSLRSADDGSAVFLSSLSHLFVAGADVDWSGIFDPGQSRRVALPLYPYQRTRYPRRPPAPRIAPKEIDAGDVKLPDVQASPAASVRLAHRLRVLTPDLVRAEIESEIRVQLGRVLALPPTSRLLDGRFRSLGLDSLMALQVRNALAAEMGLRLPQGLLFTHDTLDSLSRYLADRWRNSPELPAAEVAPAAVHDPYCLSPGQRRFWFLERLAPGTGLYHVLSMTAIHGPVDRRILAQSLNDVVRRHDVLRTLFEDAGGRPRAKVSPTAEVEVAIHDFTTFEHARAAAVRFANEFGSRPFDLTRDIPIRAALVAIAAPPAAEHILVVVQHHIATDGWSQAMFRRELIGGYETLAAQRALPETRAVFQHADAAAWDARWRTTSECAAQRRFWAEKLRALPRVDLRSKRVPPAERTYRGGHVPFTLTQEVTDGIKQLAAREACTVFHLLVACFAALLHRVSGQTDLGIGTIVANRPTREAGEILGPFVNTVVLRCDLSENPAFSRLIAHVRAVALDAFEHARLPFDEIMRTHAGSRRGELNPLVRHCFALQNVAGGPVRSASGLTWTDASPNPAGALDGTAKFDLNLVMAESGARLGGVFEYSADLFDAPTVEGFASRFEALLRTALANPARRINEGASVSAFANVAATPEVPSRTGPAGTAEAIVAGIWRDALGHDDFGTTDDFFAVGGHSLLLLRVVNALEQAFGTRCRVADLFRHTTVTAIAQEMSARAAAAIVRAGSAPTHAMAPLDVEFERRADRTPHEIALRDAAGTTMSCEALARHAAGASVRLRELGVGPGALVGMHLPRSVDYVAFVLATLHCGAAVVPLPPGDPPARTNAIVSFAGLRAIVRPDGVHAVGTHPPASSPAVERRVEDAAYILATSGSTGDPKLIVRSHRSFAHRLRWTQRVLPYDRSDVCCLKSHMTTTHAVYELFEPLLGGAPCVLVPGSVARDLEAMWERITALGITRLLAVPSFVRASIESPRFTFPPSLRVLTLMGEAVDAALALNLVTAAPQDMALYSMYGTTEASSSLVCDLRLDLRHDRLPLGRPLDLSIEIDVLDDEGAPVSPGGEGLLHVGGSPLFSGYLGHADPAPRRFNTGDRLRVGFDGALEFLGRRDRTTNVRGFRVDLDEIERVLLGQEGVTAAAVIVDREAPGGDTLRAFIAPATVDREAILARLKSTLPGFMIPGRLHFVEAADLPHTPSGKIDRRALATIAPAAPGTADVE